jgi:uncharacterized phage protein gp47/JayE
MTTPARIPDWFDVFWAQHRDKLPLLMRGDTVKEMARQLLGAATQEAAKYAATPQGVRGLIAFSRIAAIVKGVNGVCDSPDPSPEEVAAAVERLVQRVKP